MPNVDLEQVIEVMIDLARKHPGQPVILIVDERDPDGDPMVGVLNISPEAEDYFYNPIQLGDVEKVAS